MLTSMQIDLKHFDSEASLLQCTLLSPQANEEALIHSCPFCGASCQAGVYPRAPILQDCPSL